MSAARLAPAAYHDAPPAPADDPQRIIHVNVLQPKNND